MLGYSSAYHAAYVRDIRIALQEGRTVRLARAFARVLKPPNCCYGAAFNGECIPPSVHDFEQVLGRLIHNGSPSWSYAANPLDTVTKGTISQTSPASHLTPSTTACYLAEVPACCTGNLERVPRIELGSTGWKPGTLPICHARIKKSRASVIETKFTA